MNVPFQYRFTVAIQVSAGNDYIGERTFHAFIKTVFLLLLLVDTVYLNLVRMNDSYEANTSYPLVALHILQRKIGFLFIYKSYYTHLELARLHIVHFPLLTAQHYNLIR